LQLDDVKEIFEKQGEFIFKINEFYLQSLPDSYDISPSNIRLAFQRSFLNFLKDPLTKEQIVNWEQKYQSRLSKDIQDAEISDTDMCRAAEEYFVNLAHCGAHKLVPENIMLHIVECPKCCRRFLKFFSVFHMPLAEERQRYIQEMSAQLVRHFSLLEEKVYCRDVKQFLPLLADPEFEIGIPTPVTVHIENCPLCARDLGKLFNLNLKSKQLRRLAKFYSKSVFPESDECPDVREVIDLIAAFRFDAVPIRFVEHICRCNSCRQLVQEKRTFQTAKQVVEASASDEQNKDNYPCQIVNAVDLFDYCLPFAIDVSDAENHVLRGHFISHLNSCPACMEKLCILDELLHSIGQRPDSGIVIRYGINGQLPRSVELFPASDTPDDAIYSDSTFWRAGADISCQTAKQFLPLLADPQEKTAVSALVTSHIETCPQCKTDIETIHSWGLSYKKRARFADFLSEPKIEHSDSCAAIMANSELISDLLNRMQFEQLSPDTLKHICLCRSCRNFIYRARLELQVKAADIENLQQIPCDTVNASCLFDYVFPYGIDPSQDEYAKFRKSFTEHLCRCPKCLEKMRQLHNSIYSIADRGILESPQAFKVIRAHGYRRLIVNKLRKIGMTTSLGREEFDNLPTNLSKAQDETNPYNAWGITVEVSGKSASSILQTPRKKHDRTKKQRPL